MSDARKIISAARAGLRSIVITDPDPVARTQIFPDATVTAVTQGGSAGAMDGVGGMAATGATLKPGVANMDGVASMAIVPVHGVTGAAQMDGVASMAAGTIAAVSGAARMDGVASVDIRAAGAIAGAARMDGVGTMEAPIPLGAANAHMDGAASAAFVGLRIGPTIHTGALADGIIGADDPSQVSVNYHKVIIQALTASSSNVTKRFVALIDALRFGQSLVPHTTFHFTFTDNLRIIPLVSPFANAILSLVQGLTLSSTMTQKYIWGRAVNEVTKFASTVSAAGTYKKVLTQVFNFASAFQFTSKASLTQAMHISSTGAIGVALKLLQSVLVASSASPVFNYHLTLTARVLVSDLLGHFVSVVLSQLFTMHATVGRQFVANNTLSQLLSISPVFTNKLILQIVGNVQLTPSQLVNMIYTGDALLDGLMITGLHISPSGTTTTWVVNTRTNAVTEYQNYNFNSFAAMGNRYVAAGQDGLYELDGDTDDGQPIISELMGGYFQLNDKKLFGLKGVYVAIRGGNRFYLKLLTGDGREYIYELKSQPNMMTTKVNIGKGLRTTYMAFDLITEGQDWDLDSLEFVPMTSGRRV